MPTMRCRRPWSISNANLQVERNQRVLLHYAATTTAAKPTTRLITVCPKPWRRAKRLAASTTARVLGWRTNTATNNANGATSYSKQQWMARRGSVGREIDGSDNGDVEANEDSMVQQDDEPQRPVSKPGAYAIEGIGADDGEDYTEDWMREDSTNRPVDATAVEAQVDLVKQQQEENTSPHSCWNNRMRWIVAISTTVVVAIVVVAVTVSSSSKESESPMVAPFTNAPTSAPTVDPWAECYQDSNGFSKLNFRLQARPNFGFAYIFLCAQTDILVASLWDWTFPFYGTKPPLNLQSNTHIRCGTTGALTNECVAPGETDNADALVLNAKASADELAAQNVTIEGITFEDAPVNLVNLYNGGEITFRNCLFRSRGSYIPILLDFTTKDTQIQQHVTFEGCIFEDMVFGENRPGSETATMVRVSHPANTVTFRECVFRNIKGFRQSPGYLITSLGGEVHMERSCFYGMTGSGISPFLLAGDSGSNTLMSLQGNFVDGLWTCDSEGSLLGDEESCIELGASSSVCLAPIVNLNINW